MTDIFSMLVQAQSKANTEMNMQSASNSVDLFFKQASTNKKVAPPSMPIQIQNLTLESIERNFRISPTNPENSNAQNVDLANSPLAKFINSNMNLNTPNIVQETTNTSKMVTGTGLQAPPGFVITQQQHQQQQLQQQAPMQPKTNGNNKETKLLTPNMLIQSNVNNVEKKQQPEPLTKNQLIQALKFLMDSDDEFNKKVHDAYLKSLKS